MKLRSRDETRPRDPSHSDTSVGTVASGLSDPVRRTSAPALEKSSRAWRAVDTDSSGGCDEHWAQSAPLFERMLQTIK
jgi:hypothetical protein